jgi:hypothetical protein
MKSFWTGFGAGLDITSIAISNAISTGHQGTKEKKEKKNRRTESGSTGRLGDTEYMWILVTRYAQNFSVPTCSMGGTQKKRG